MKKRLAAAVFAAFIGFVFLFAQGPVQKVRLWDTNLSHSLLLTWNENDTAGRTLNFLVDGATRSLTISGDSYIDQDVRIAATPYHAGLYLSSSSVAPFLKLSNASGTARDPIIQFAVGATPVTKFTMGVDDSDNDKWKISAGSALGTTDRITITDAGWIGFNTPTPLAPIHYTTPSPGNIPDVILQETEVDKALQFRLTNSVRSWDIVSDSNPDRFGIHDVTEDEHPFFIEGGTPNIGLFYKQSRTQWEYDKNSGTKFGTNAANIIGWSYGSGASVFPTTVPSGTIQLGAFSRGLGIKANPSAIVSYYGGPKTYINETDNDDMTVGLTINAGPYQDQVLAFKSSLVAHGMTTLAETDTFADFRINTDEGGLEINAYTEGTSVPLGLYAWYPTGDIGLDSTAWGAVTIYAGKKSETTYGDVGATDNIFVLRPRYGSAWTSCFVVDATGHSWQSGMLTAPQGTFNIADGTAPLVITSTTEVANLNVHLLQGNHANAFEPALGNPGTTGWVLSSTDAGVRSWIAPVGGGTFLSLTDVDEPDYTGHAGHFVVVNGDEDALIFSASSVAAHNLSSVSHLDVDADTPDDNDILRFDTASGTWMNEALPAAGNHDLLSATHGDTTAAAVTRGAMIAGLGASPKWTAVVAGTEGYVWTMGADEPEWAESSSGSPGMVTLLNEAFDGLATAAISGQGSYTYFGAWAVTLVGTSTATVAIKSGTDKMGVLTGDTVTEGSSYVYLTTGAAWPWGLCYGTRFHFKMRTSNVTIGTKGWNLGSDSDVDECQVYFRTTGSKITFWNGSANTDMMTAVNDTWYTIDVFILGGTTTPYALVFINGVQMGAPKACGANSEAWNQVGFYCNTTGTASPINLDFDDFYIGTNWFFDLVD